MISKPLRFAFLASILAVLIISPLLYSPSANTAFAEGDVTCSGKIMGTTKTPNPNFGQLNFDSHPSPYPDANKVTDLSITGGGQGLAPATRNYAACVDTSPTPDEYIFRGYAWNTNLGFFSFFCDGTKKNQGITCGDYTYGVKIGTADGLGNRNLSGNAWNPAFGYMQFSGGGAFPYQVVADKNGNLTGWAWTEAKVWVDMSGVQIQIPGKEIVKNVVGACSATPFICLEVTTDPEKGLSKVTSGNNGSGGIKINTDNEVKVANGSDYYQVELYLKDASGTVPLDITKYKVGPTLTFTWADTVKIDQTFSGQKADQTLALEPTPWASGKGGIVYKPITATFPNDFTDMGSGHYILNKKGGVHNDGKIQSYSPTTDMNISYTTSMKPNVSFKNEVFFNKMKNFGDVIPSVEENKLKLSKMEVPLIEIATGQAPLGSKGLPFDGVVYPNNKDGLNLQFRPAVEVNTLYADNNKDSIDGYRTIPFTFRVGGKKDPLIPSTSVNLKMDYSEVDTKDACANNTQEYVNGFAVHFVEEGGSFNHQWSPTNNQYDFDLQAVAELQGYDDLSDEDKAKSGITKPCSKVVGPTLYSVVSYTVGSNTVKYYSNKLPRLVSTIANPVAIIHGNLYGTKAFSPSASTDTQETGTKSVNLVRDGIYENIASKLRAALANDKTGKNSQSSTITSFSDSSPKTSGTSPKNMTLDGNSVAIYDKTDVHISLSQADSYAKNATIIVMNGNVFIDNDIYKANGDKLQIISLRPYSSGCNKGNIYIKNTVKNINANMFTDCSVLSYVDENQIDQSTQGSGLYKWASFGDMVDALSLQLRIWGSIASHNTIGGSDLDKDESNPDAKCLLDGFQCVQLSTITSQQRLDVQSRDLNYFRLFKQQIQINELGQPVDQSCGKALTLEEMIQIKDQIEATGESTIIGDNGIACNGIDALSAYDPTDPTGTGDLIAPVNGDNLAQGLNNGLTPPPPGKKATDFEPVYVLYSASDSSIFQR